jgi:hypothetical protein
MHIYSQYIIPANSGRIYKLQTRIRHAEKYNVNSCKNEKELADLLEEEKKKDILRRLPLYSSKIDTP